MSDRLVNRRMRREQCALALVCIGKFVGITVSDNLSLLMRRLPSASTTPVFQRQ